MDDSQCSDIAPISGRRMVDEGGERRTDMGISYPKPKLNAVYTVRYDILIFIPSLTRTEYCDQRKRHGRMA
jgi:hypothetical protein